LSSPAARRGSLVVGLAALAGAVALSSLAPAEDAPRRGGLSLREVSDFVQPMYAHGPKGAPGVLYVVEREGEIKVLRNGERRGTFLDIKNLVGCCESERGLFSIAFAPWRKSRRFYVFFTDNQGDLRISEFKRNRNNPLRAAERSRRDLLDIRHRSAANHNGGQLQWGPDGKLYIATGDGGTGGGPAQSKASLLGKILRINPLRRKGPGRYSTPKDNPYVGRSGANEILAKGLRNPWRFSFDRGRIVIGDVGESNFEEVDYERIRQADGANFGWNHYEGNARRGSRLGGHDKPIHVYSHGSGRCAITGGYVVRDDDLPGLKGRYVYGDLCTGQIRSLRPKLSGARGDSATGLSTGSLVSFGTDARDNLYVVAGGTVYRVVRN
jgi:glucose/arabinose dehydrogenase